MNWLFRRDSAVAPFLSGAQKDETDVLKNAFCHAAYGRNCRTKTYASPAYPEKSEWLEAYASATVDSGPGWRILKKTKPTGQHPSGMAVILQKEIASKLTFFAAIEYLARYESGQLAFSYLNIVDNETEKLGLTHFRAFARREGIAFDLDGKPHPTDLGRIVTNGAFPETEYDIAQTAAQIKLAELKSGMILPAINPQIFAEKKADIQAANELLWILRAAMRVREFAAVSNNMAWLVDNAAGGNLSIDVAKSWADAYKDLMIFLNPKKLAKLHLPVVLEPLVMKFRYDFLVHEAANITVHRERNTFDPSNKSFYTQKSVDRIEARAADLLQKMGYSGHAGQEVFREIQNCKCVIEHGGADLFKNFKEIIRFVEDLIAFSQQGLGIENGKKLALPPPPPSI